MTLDSIDIIPNEPITLIPRDELFKISVANHPNEFIEKKHFETYIRSIEELLEDIVPNEFFENAKNEPTSFNVKEAFLKLYQNIPFVYSTELTKAPSYFLFYVLCQGEFTHGVGRFVPDMINRWLIPGRQLPINGNRSLQFNFKHFPQKRFYLSEYVIYIRNEKEIELIQKNLKKFIHELTLIILSVFHSRYIVSSNLLSYEQKSAMIQDNLESLFDKKSRDEHTAFDQVQDFLVKLSEEKKLSEIKENIAHLMYKKPQTFDRDIFDSVHHVSLLFRGSFATTRQPKHVSRIISFQYLFKKTMKKVIENSSNNKRHVYLKLLKTQLNAKSEKTILGILIVMNLLHENEYFEKEYILDAIDQCISNFKYIKNSYIVDHRDDKMLSFYIEIEKDENNYFTSEEITSLRNKLPQEFTSRMSNVINPIFMPRNEEEILRNIVILTKQLKYVRDLPQVIISYDKQTGKEISFNVILARLIKKDSIALSELFSFSETFLRFLPEETKIVGLLKKKYPKEINIFKLSLKKFKFFRRDYSLDLQKARQTIVNEMTKVMGEFRDFNGGMISKQNQALDTLKSSLGTLEKPHEFLLENFFYSIKPAVSQSILSTDIMKNFFLMFIELAKQEFIQNSYLIKTLSHEKYFFIMIGAVSSKYKEELSNSINKLKISSDLISTSVNTVNIKMLGYILKTDDPGKRSTLHNCVIKEMQKVFNGS